MFFDPIGRAESKKTLRNILIRGGSDAGQLSAEMSTVPDLGVLPLSLRRLRKEQYEVGNIDKTAAFTPKVYDVGQTVFVEKRTWPGMNKLGGYGRIKAAKPVEDPQGDILYTVCYVLGGIEREISSRYIHLSEEEHQGRIAATSSRFGCWI